MPLPKYTFDSPGNPKHVFQLSSYASVRPRLFCTAIFAQKGTVLQYQQMSIFYSSDISNTFFSVIRIIPCIHGKLSVYIFVCFRGYPNRMPCFGFNLPTNV